MARRPLGQGVAFLWSSQGILLQIIVKLNDRIK